LEAQPTELAWNIAYTLTKVVGEFGKVISTRMALVTRSLRYGPMISFRRPSLLTRLKRPRSVQKRKAGSHGRCPHLASIIRDRDRSALSAALIVISVQMNRCILLDSYSSIHRDSTSFHHHIIINDFRACIPRNYLLGWSPERKCKSFVAGFEGTIA